MVGLPEHKQADSEKDLTVDTCLLEMSKESVKRNRWLAYASHDLAGSSAKMHVRQTA